ncbi:MAG: HAD family hydrolase [Clostridia bacterium]|nr:HAD family hydrolase [Clostridia bacterium]
MDKKVVIFDFDGTFYTGPQAFSKIEEYTNKNRRKLLASLTKKQYDLVASENPEWNNVWLGSEVVDFVYFLKQKYPQFNITIKDFWNWQNSKPDPIVIDKNQVVDTNFLQDICKKFPTYIVSNSSPTHILFYMKKLNIDPKWFVKIVSNHFIAKDRTKKHYYQDILEKENCLPQNCFVFGDSIKNDLEPAQILGINTYFIDNANDLPSIVNKALNI